MLLVISLTITGLYTGTQKSFAAGDKPTSDERLIEDGLYEISSKLGAIGVLGYEIGFFYNSHGLNQKFHIRYDDKQKTYSVRSVYTGMYLGAKKQEGKEPDQLCQAPKGKEYYQDWKVVRDNGLYALELVISAGKSVKLISNLRNFMLSSDKSKGKALGLKKIELYNGMYEITSPALFGRSYSVLDTSGVDVKTGQGMGIRERDGYANQKFYIERQYDAATKDTYYTIMCMYPRMLLGVDEKGKLICKNAAEDPKRYRWEVKQTVDGYVKIKSKSTGQVLEIDGTKLSLNCASQTDKQKFIFSNVIDKALIECQILSSADKSKAIERKDKKLIIGECKNRDADGQCFFVGYNSENGSCTVKSVSECIGISSSEMCKPGTMVSMVDNYGGSNSSWMILRFKDAGKEYVSFVLRSSLEDSGKKSEYLSLNAPLEAGKELVLTNRSLIGIGTQSFEIVSSEAAKAFSEALYQKAMSGLITRQPKPQALTNPLFPDKEEIEPVEEPKALAAQELEKKEKISKSLSVDDLKKRYPEYADYLDHVVDIMDPKKRSAIKPDVMKNQDKSLKTIAEKLSYIYGKINSSPEVSHLEEYPVQMLAVLKLVNSVLNPKDGNKGSIGEIKTGEGKSFIVMLSAILLQSYGRTVDIVAPNMALVKRDSKEQEKYYKLFGISGGYLYNKNADPSFRDELNDTPGAIEEREKEVEKDNEKRKCVVNREYNVEVFKNDVVYSTSGNFQWVYLYERMAGVSRSRKYDVCLVDEADDILLDGSSNPAQLAESFSTDRSDNILETIFNKVKAKPDFKEADEAQLRKELQDAISKDEAKDEVPWEEKGPGAKFDEKEIKLMVEAAKEALKLDKDKDYICKDGKVVLVDRNTGFILPNTKLHAYIHEMIEIKEKMKKSPPSVTTCAISPLTFFNGYANLIGVTGTAGGAEEEGLYKKWYRLETFRVPTNREIQRDVVLNLLDEGEDRHAQLEAEIKEYSENRKQPVLVILDSIRATKALKEKFPKANLIQGIDIDKDKVSIAQAGQAGTITLSTVAAGRGTDIKLTQEALDAGGLHVIVANLPARSRTLMQNIGRCSRQGQPGSATVYVSPRDSFQEGYNFSPSTWNLFKIQEMFYDYIKATWPDLMRVDRKYYGMAKYRFGATVDDILAANERMIARRFFWPGKKNDEGELFMYINDEEYHMYLNMVYDMILKAWGRFYTDLSMSPESDIWEKDGKGCKPKYDAFIAKIKAWVPKKNGKDLPIGQWIRAFAEKKYPGSDKNFGEIVFHKLYEDWRSDETIEDFIYRLLRDPLVQIHMSSVGINTWAKGITDEKFAFLPKKHQDAYRKLLAERAEHEAKVAQYWRDMAAYDERLALRERIMGKNAANAEARAAIEKEMKHFQGKMSGAIQDAEAERDRQTRETIDAYDKTESSNSLPFVQVCHALTPPDCDIEYRIEQLRQKIVEADQKADEYRNEAIRLENEPKPSHRNVFDPTAPFRAKWKRREAERYERLAAEYRAAMLKILRKREKLQQNVAGLKGDLLSGTTDLKQKWESMKDQVPPEMLKKPEYPKEPKWSEIGREDFCDLSINDLIWVLFGDPQRVVAEHRNAMIPDLEKSYGGHLPQELINYLDNQILNMMREEARSIQESAREAGKLEKRIKAEEKAIEVLDKAAMTVATVGVAIASGGTAIPIIATAFAAGETALAISDAVEGTQDFVSSCTGEHVLTRSYNPIRDDLCGGNEGTYKVVETVMDLGCVAVTGASAVKSLRAAWKAGKIAGEVPEVLRVESGARTIQEAGISSSDAKRIQNAADRTHQDIVVIGSRANGNATSISDWDYIMSGNSLQRHSAASSVPHGIQGGEINSAGRETGIDIFTNNPNSPYCHPLDKTKPYVIFSPKK